MIKTYIFTVGTSLVQKQQLSGLIEDIKYLGISNKDIIAEDDIKEKNVYMSAESYLKNLNEHNLKDFTAEIATLKLITEFKKDENKIILLSSDTPDGAFCTRVNYEYMKIVMATTNIEMKLIDKTDINKPNEFVENGLNNIVSYLRNITDSVLCFTGGYKALIPALTLMANKNKIPMFYLFEPDTENPELIKINIRNDKITLVDKEGKETEIEIPEIRVEPADESS